MSMATSSLESIPSPLNGRVAIVTGATDGIGHATALHLASLGVSISLIFSSSSEEAHLLAEKINSYSSASIPQAIPIGADISDPDNVRSLFASLHMFDTIMAVNARSAFLVLQQAANRVAGDGRGRIIALSSWLAETNQPGYGIYAASKATLRQ